MLCLASILLSRPYVVWVYGTLYEYSTNTLLYVPKIVCLDTCLHTPVIWTTETPHYVCLQGSVCVL